MNTMWFALCVTYLFLGRIALTSVLKTPTYSCQDSGFVSAELGDSVTLQCSYTGDAAMFYWYKQTLGQKPRLLSTYHEDDNGGILQNEFKSDSRFALDTGNGNNHLTISDLRISDSATYYCTTDYKYAFEFVEGITVSVKGSGLNIPALVHQSASESIQPGDSVNCTAHTGICDEEHSVYWFRHSKGLHPGLMYTHGGRNDQCGSKNNTQTHTCVYNLPTKSLNRSHAGTYCAVASCGHILFGVEKMPSKRKGDSSVLVYCLTGVLTFSTILVVLLAYAAYTLNKRKGCGRTDSQSSASLSPNAGNNQDSDNLHYAALKEFRPNWSPRQMDDTQSECVYSGVRQ